jgi:hypothetical protein
MDFTPQCPRCASHDVKVVGSHDYYLLFSPRLPDTPPEYTIFAYKCVCGLAFTFEIKHGANERIGGRYSTRLRQAR